MGIRIESIEIGWADVTGLGERPQFVTNKVRAYGTWTVNDGTRVSFETDVTATDEFVALMTLLSRIGERVAKEMAN